MRCMTRGFLRIEMGRSGANLYGEQHEDTLRGTRSWNSGTVRVGPELKKNGASQRCGEYSPDQAPESMDLETRRA